MPGTRTADKYFGEGMNHTPHTLSETVGQEEGREATKAGVIAFLKGLYPQEAHQINEKNYRTYEKRYYASLGVR